MKKLIVAGLAALALACGSDKAEKPIQYGAPQAATIDEQSAAATAETTLSGTLFDSTGSTPEAGAPGLANQLVASLGGYTMAKTMPTVQSQKLAASAVSRAITGGGIDPACVAPTATSVTWTGCTDTMTITDPGTGDTTTTTVTVDGTLTWNPATGLTTWNIHETARMTETQSGSTVMALDTTADLSGSLTVTASTISGNTSSNVTVRGSAMGIPLNAGLLTTLAVNVGYAGDPPCITSGTLVLEQRWTQRPVGATEATAPNQGWRFEWTGCGLFTVAHGG